MKAEEIHGLSDADLRRSLEESRQELFNLRFQIATRKIKNHRRIPLVKKDIARLMTAIRERELMGVYDAGGNIAQAAAEAIASQATPRRRGLLGRLGRGR